MLICINYLNQSVVTKLTDIIANLKTIAGNNCMCNVKLHNIPGDIAQCQYTNNVYEKKLFLNKILIGRGRRF